MRRRAVGWLAGLTAVAALTTSATGARPTTWTHGFDISWPQCSGSSAHHLPRSASTYVVLGLTHGAGHTANPCLSDQLSWARAEGARVGGYLVPSYPTAAERSAADVGVYGACHGKRICRLHNDGVAQAVDALATMHRAGLSLPMVWVDVEFRRHPVWPHDHAANRAVLAGVFRGLRDAGVAYGIYTTSYMWQHITGGWTVRVPNWLPSGNGKPASAKRKCATSGTGGVTWLVQYTRTWDEDLTCPVMNPLPSKPGPLWRYRNTELSRGSKGRAVSVLQQAIGMSPSGDYDLGTTLTVAEWQHSDGRPATGSVNSEDWRVLGAFKRTGGRPFLLYRMTTS